MSLNAFKLLRLTGRIKNGGSDAAVIDVFEEKQQQQNRTFVRIDAVPRITEDYKLSKKIWIHASRHIIINTDSEGETGKSGMVRGHWGTGTATITATLDSTLNLKRTRL